MGGAYGAGRYGVGKYGMGEIIVTLPPYFPDLGNWGGKKPEVTDANRVFIELAEKLAWTTMIRLSGWSVVVEPVTVRPLCEVCASRTWLTDPAAFSILDGVLPWDSMTLRGFGSAWGCGHGHKVLPLSRPTGRIVEIKVDGAKLDPSAYRIDNGNELTRIDGGAWPTQQDPFAAIGAPGTFDITYYPGYRPDTLFVWATGQLAYEFYLGIVPKELKPAGRSECRLPSGVTSIVRQGVSYEIESVPFTAGRTGITEIDVVLARYNPNGLSARPTVTSPDTLRQRPRLIGR